MGCWLHFGSEDVSSRADDLRKGTFLLFLTGEYMIWKTKGSQSIRNTWAMGFTVYFKMPHLEMSPGPCLPPQGNSYAKPWLMFPDPLILSSASYWAATSSPPWSSQHERGGQVKVVYSVASKLILLRRGKGDFYRLETGVSCGSIENISLPGCRSVNLLSDSMGSAMYRSFVHGWESNLAVAVTRYLLVVTNPAYRDPYA